MNLAKYQITDIAEMQINSACRIYLSGMDFFSSLTLAGAAEEVFGKLSKQFDKTNAVENLAKSLLAIMNISQSPFDPVNVNPEHPVTKNIAAIIANLNTPRNSIKHYALDLDENDAFIEVDPIEEAWSMIFRAIENYYICRNTYTEPMLEFLRHDRKQFRNPLTNDIGSQP